MPKKKQSGRTGAARTRTTRTVPPRQSRKTRRRGFPSFVDRASAEEMARRLRAGESAVEIAAELGRDARTVEEAERALRAVPEIADHVAMNGGIMIRVAARAEGLPKSAQRSIARKLCGKCVTIGLGIVQACERKLGIVQRGRKPGSGRGPTRHVQVHLNGIGRKALSPRELQQLRSCRQAIERIIATHSESVNGGTK